MTMGMSKAYTDHFNLVSYEDKWEIMAKGMTIHELLNEFHRESMLQAKEGTTDMRRAKQDVLRKAIVDRSN